MHFEHALLLHICIINGETKLPLSKEELFTYLYQKGQIKREDFDYSCELYEKYKRFSSELKRKVAQNIKEFEANEYWIQTRDEPQEDKIKRFFINAKRYEEVMNEIFEETPHVPNNISLFLLEIKSWLQQKNK
ncbi:hypothetical protein [Bacillus paramycoides]|uniref:hypothetical protein n=1 Tax=Bacillus paramycoides TaxID=2026194 RepID=UPI002E21F370|nr:hypothetical protein [Bacillus paramycoides]